MQLKKPLQADRSEQAKITNNIHYLLERALRRESSALHHLSTNIPHLADSLVTKIVETKGKLIFSGIGKSWLVAQKLAATFCGLGISALGMHGGDALHGDLGVIQQQDMVIVLSKSGTGTEFEYLFSSLRMQGIFTTLICCKNGPLCKHADLVIQLDFDREACEFDLAPTTSSTITMAFGDALAIAASHLKGFTKIDFARYHPDGALGRRLLLTVDSIMHKQDALPLVKHDTPFSDLMYIISSKKVGMGIVVDKQQSLIGVITDGDLRRACEQGTSVFEKTAIELMNSDQKIIEPKALVTQALEAMERYTITNLVVVEKKVVVGVIHIHDIIKAGIVG